jgi:aryl-alcohol dehydrogenase-like predicted oxidoreductase
MTVLHELVKEGKVRNIGASNLSTNQLAEANQISNQHALTPYLVLQQEYSYIHPKLDADTGITNHADEEMFRYIEKEKLAFCAYSPLLKGIYGSRSKRQQYYNWHLFNSKENIEKLDLVEKLASQINITGNQLILTWMLHNEHSIFPMLGFSRIEQYYDNIMVHDLELPKDIMDLLNELN